MAHIEELLERFFNEYKIALHPREFNRYLLSIGEPAITEREIGRELRSIKWTEIVSTLYSKTKRHNPFLGTSKGGHKRFEIPFYTKNAYFCYPRDHEEYLWARFIFMPYSTPERKALWVGMAKKGNRRLGILAIGAPPRALKELYEAGKNMTIAQLSEKLGYGKSYITHPTRIFFEPYVRHLIDKFIIGSKEYGAKNEYALTTFGKKCCELAFSPEFQKRFFELERNKIFAARL